MRAEVGWVIVDNLDFGDQTGARVGSFNQIVAENRVRGKSAAQNLAKHIDFVNSLAGENALCKQILINVRNRVGINVQAGLARINECQTGTMDGINADSYPGLQYPVPVPDRIGRRSIRAWLRGCAIAATSRPAESRGNCVSESRVMT